MLLIDASNSMKGSIDGAMRGSARLRARNPGQPLSVVFFSASPTVALPLTTDREQIDAVLAKPPKLTEGTRIYDALAAAVAQVRGSALGAARIVLLSDGDDVGSVTSLDSALVAARGTEHPRLHRRDRVVRLHARRSRAHRGGHRRHVCRGDLRRRAHEDLRRARFRARQRVPHSLPLSGAPGRERRRRGRPRRRGAGRLLVPEPSDGHGRPLQAGVPRRADAVLAAACRSSS